MKNYSNTRVKTILLILLYSATAFYWYILMLNDAMGTSANFWYQVFLAAIPLLGAVFGFINSARWGGLKSRLGQAVFFLSAGLASWGIGQCYWAYVTIRQIEQIPYPSWADVGYVTALPLWIAGVLMLTLAAGARSSIRRHAASAKKIALAAIAAFVVALGSATLLFIVAKDISLSADAIGAGLVDLAYPMGDVIIITIAAISLTLLLNYLGGRYRTAIMAIIVGFILMYVTDFTFSYVIGNDTYFNGHFVDFLFPTVMAILSWGIIKLAPPTVDHVEKVETRPAVPPAVQNANPSATPPDGA